MTSAIVQRSWVLGSERVIAMLMSFVSFDLRTSFTSLLPVSAMAVALPQPSSPQATVRALSFSKQLWFADLLMVPCACTRSSSQRPWGGELSHSLQNLCTK
jgi:hypothetical protein